MIFYYITLFFLFVCSFIFYKKLGTFFNPVSLFTFSLFISVLSVYFADNSGLLRALKLSDSFNVLILYNLAAALFVLPWFLINKHDVKINNSISKERNMNLLSIFLCLAFVILSLIAYLLLGGIPVLKMISGELNVLDYNDLIKRLPIGMLSLFLIISTISSLLFASFVSNKQNNGYSSWFLFFVFILSLFSTIWQGKRQGILMLVFFVIARYYQNTPNYFKKKKSIRKKIYVLAFIGFFVISFMQIGKIRLNNSEVDDMEILSYTMYPILNFSSTVSAIPNHGSTLFPGIILADILPSRISETMKVKVIEYEIFEPTSPSGYLDPWYRNYGIYGILIGTLFLSYVSLNQYRKRNISENYMRKNILLLWCCVTVGIYSHFITLNFYILPMLFLYLIDILKNKKLFENS